MQSCTLEIHWHEGYHMGTLLHSAREPQTHFGTELRKLRLEHNLTQVQLAELIGTHSGRISNYELGRVPKVLESSLVRLESVLCDTKNRRLRRALDRDYRDTHVAITEFGKTVIDCCVNTGLELSDVARAWNVSLTRARLIVYDRHSRSIQEDRILALNTLFGVDRSVFEPFVCQNYGEDIKKPKTFAQFVSKRMFDLRLTRKRLADAVGVSAQCIADVCSEKYVPEDRRLRKFARALQAQVDTVCLLADKSRNRPVRHSRYV